MEPKRAIAAATLAALLVTLLSCPTLPRPATSALGVAALARVAAERAVDLLLRADAEPATIAVAHFTAGGKPLPPGGRLAEAVTTELANLALAVDLGVKVVTRANLDAMLGELSFQLSDLADPAKSAKVGELLGAEALLTGAIAKTALGYRLDAQIVYVETGVVLGGFSVDFLPGPGEEAEFGGVAE